MRRPVTGSVDEELIEAAKAVAAGRAKSVSARAWKTFGLR
jgi:hypothetical protein